MATNDEASRSSLHLESAGDEKLASEYEQFMKMVCTDIPVPSVTDMTKEYSPKRNPHKSTSPHSYHEFNIESNLVEDNANIEMPLKENFEDKDKLDVGSIKSMERDGSSTLSMDCQMQDEDTVRTEHKIDDDETDDSKSIPSDWENVRIKVERLSDENTESREVKKKKKQRKSTSSSDSYSSTSSSDSERGRKRKKSRRKMLSNSSSSDSDSTDSSSSSSSSDSSSSDEKRKRKRKKKKIGKKRKKARRVARTKKKRRRKVSTDSSSSDSDERPKKKKRIKKKAKEAKQFDPKSINNGDITKVMSKSSLVTSPSDEAKLLHSMSPAKKIKEEIMIEDKKRATSARKSIASMRDNEYMKQRREKKENKSDENFMEEWEMDAMITMRQSDDDTSSEDDIEEVGKVDNLEKDKYRRKRKLSRDEQDDIKLSKISEGGKGRLEEELEAKRKKRREKDVRSNTEFLANWEREDECIAQHIMQNEVKSSKKLEKRKKEKWGETDFDTLNVPSLTQLEKEVCRKQLLADEWEVDSLEAIPDLTVNKRKSSQTSKKKEKEVRYDKKTDTYIAIEKESAREMKKRQERLCAIRIWEEEQEEGEKEQIMLLEQKRKKDDWDIEEESFLRKNDEELDIHKIDEIINAEKEWSKLDEDTDVKEDASKLMMMKLEAVGSKRTKKSRWDMGSQSEEKSESKDMWEEEYTEWSKIKKCEQELGKTEKGGSHITDSSKIDRTEP